MTTLRVATAPGIFDGVGLDPIGEGVFTLGYTMPTIENSGVPAGTTLTPYDSDIVTPRTIQVTSPTVFDRVDFGNVRVDVRSPGVVFDTCRWVVTANRSQTAMVRLDQASPGGDTLISQCTIINEDQLGYQYNAIQGHDFTAYRCLIMGTVDGVRPNLGGNVKVHGCFIGYLGWWGTEDGKPSLNSGYQSHSDCIQTTYGGVEIIGNSLWAYPSMTVGTGTPGSGTDTGTPDGWYTQAEAEARRAASQAGWTDGAQSADGESHWYGGIVNPLMCNRATGPFALNLLVTDNWFAGGQVHVNGLNDNLESPLGTFKRNRHFNDAQYKAAGKSFAYRLKAGLEADIPTIGDDMNYYLDGSGAALIVV